MVSLPKFAKRAAEQIARLEADHRAHLPPGDYLSFIGYEIDVEPDYPPDPPFRLHYIFSDAEGVPEEFKVECHGMRLAYNIHERFLAKRRAVPTLCAAEREPSEVDSRRPQLSRTLYTVRKNYLAQRCS
jgi:hypothetical protein